MLRATFSRNFAWFGGPGNFRETLSTLGVSGKFCETSCWLPDSDDFARSSNDTPETTADLGAKFTGPEERVLSVSKIYSWQDASLSRIVASALLKATHAQYRPVDLLSLTRSYVTFTADTWSWGKLPQSSLRLPLTLALPAAGVTSVRVLRQFHGGADGQVFLGIVETEADGAGVGALLHLVVVKSHFLQEECEVERQRWELLNGPVLRQTLFGRQCLVMPFVFHVVSSDSAPPCFISDLANWGRESAAVGGARDARFDAWSVQAADLLRQWTPETALRAAVEGVADQRYVHLDLEWRHVALLPVVEEGQICELKPVLIDLARMEQQGDDENAAAAAAMQGRVLELLALVNAE